MPHYNDIRDVSQSARQVYEYERMELDDLFEVLLEKYRNYAKSGIKDIKKAYKIGKKFHAHQKRRSGAPYFTHPIIVAILLTEHQPDKNTIVATLLHDLIEDTDATYADLDGFDPSVIQMIDGLTKINKSQLEAFEYASHNLVNKLETIRKILRFGEHDLRVLIIKIFDRYHNILTLFWKPDTEWQLKYIEQTKEIYIPIAKRIGLREVHKKFSYYALYYQDHATFTKIQSTVETYEKKGKKLETNIVSYLKKTSSTEIVSVNVRKNDAYHLYTGKHDKNITMQDVFFVEIVVPYKKDCYNLLRDLNLPHHQNIIPIGTVKDFIAKPKLSEYQALHIDTIINGNQKIELHILSERMQRESQKKLPISKILEIYPNILFHDFDLIDEATTSNSDKFISAVMNHVFAKKMQIHNPKKKAVYVPYTFSALDAAAYLYPEKISNISTIYVNQKPVSMGHLLAPNDIIEVEFSKKSHISSKWLQSSESDVSGFRLQKALKKEGNIDTLLQGKKILQEHFDMFRLGDVRSIMHKDAKRLLGHTPNEVYQMIGQGSLMPIEVMEGLQLTGRSRLGKWTRKLIEKIDFFSSSLLAKPYISFSFYANESHVDTVSHYIQEACEGHDAHIQSLSLHAGKRGLHGKMRLVGESKRQVYESFLALTNHEHLFLKHVFLKRRFKVKIIGLLLLLLGVWCVFFGIISEKNSANMIYIGAVLPVLANMVVYRFCMYYFSSWRYSKMLLFFLSILNIIAIGFVSYTIIQSGMDTRNFSVFFPAIIGALSTIFTIIMFYKNHQFTQRKNILAENQPITVKHMVVGYVLRLLAVCIWGFLPVYTKYIVPQDVSVLTKVPLLALGMVITGLVICSVQMFFMRPSKQDLKAPINRYFFFAAFGFVVLYYLYIVSLTKTTSTNLILLTNFAPVFTLIVASFFWRKELSYMRSIQHIQSIFLVFVIGGIGSMLLFLNDLQYGAPGNLTGNLIALGVMLVDIFYIIGQIRYIKTYPTSYTGYVVGLIGLGGLLLSLPLVLIGWGEIASLSLQTIALCVGIGCFNALGLFLNLEAFKRIDGFIAHLLFNISIVLAFCLEAFLLREIIPTGLLIWSIILIVGSAFGAEYIHIQSRKKS